MNTYSFGETVSVPSTLGEWTTTVTVTPEEIAALFEPIYNDPLPERCPWDNWLAGDME